MNLAFFGGTFNPPHKGHEMMIEYCYNLFDQLLIIPNRVSPEKLNNPPISEFHRLNMLNILVSDKDIKISEAYLKSDEILANGVKGITGLITNPGVINVDFADVRTILKDAGNVVMGSASVGKRPSGPGVDVANVTRKLQAEAKAVGLTLIGAGRNHYYRTYRIDQCRHKQEFRTTEIRRNSFRCDQCLQKKLQAEAKAVGLTLIGPGKRSYQNRTYRFNKCRHEQELGVSNVRRNYIVCHTCEETSRDLPSNMYLLRIKVGSMEWVKLGYAKTVAERVKTYGLPAEAEIMQVNILPFDTGRAAHEAESSIHKKCKSKRLSSRKMKKYHTVSGYEECYPIDLMGKLSTAQLSRSTRPSTLVVPLQQE